MESIINFGIPHVGEQIFGSLDEDDLIQCLRVSQTWKAFAKTLLLPKWKSKMFGAFETGKTEIVELLLENYSYEEIGLNLKGERGMTPFMIACQNGHQDVVKILLDHSEGNINFNAKDNRGWTAFMFACQNGHKDVAKSLLAQCLFSAE